MSNVARVAKNSLWLLLQPVLLNLLSLLAIPYIARVLGDERETRITLMTEICEHLECAPVQHIGKLLLLYRPGAEPKIELPVGKKKPLPTAKVAKVEAKPKVEVRIDKGRPGGNRRRQMGNRQR